VRDKAKHPGRHVRPRFTTTAQVENKTRITGGFTPEAGWWHRTAAQMAFDRDQQIHVPFSLLSANHN
jgi:hypothetical protein